MATQAADPRARAGWLRGIGAVHEESWTAPDVRRRLQLALAGIWLLDAVLQFQAFMFSKGFSQMLGGTAAGNPAVIADPISWSAKIIAQHGTATNAIFAFIQLAIGLGIAWRPTLKLALGASIMWALGVWWFGEGLGGVLSGAGGPANGAPGAVIIYALLAVLLWPAAAPPGGPLRRRPVHRRERGPGALAGAVGQPGLHGPAARDQGAEGARRHGLSDGVRAARLAVQRRQSRGGVPDQPWPGPGRGPGGRAGRGGGERLPAPARWPGPASCWPS